MKKATKKRLLIWSTVTVVILVLLIQSLSAKPILVETSKLVKSTLTVTLDHEGKTRVREPFVISAPVSGTLERVALEPGDRVVQGETLIARIQPSLANPLDSRARSESKAMVESAQARVTQSLAEVNMAKSRLSQAQEDLQRSEKLHADKAIADRDLQLAQTEAKTSQDAVKMAMAASESARFELARAQAHALDPSLTTQTDETVDMMAPISGIVLRRIRHSAGSILAGEPIVEVGLAHDLEIIADFLSSDAAQMRPGLKATIGGWGGELLAGEVRRIDPAGFTKISALGVEEQRVNVVIDINEQRPKWQSLGEGFRVDVKVVIWEADDVLLAPTGSLFRQNGNWAVFKVVEDKAQIVVVEIGQNDGRNCQVIEGLSKGDSVVLHPPENLIDGATIEARFN